MKYTVKVDTQGAVKNVDKLGSAFGGLKKIGVAAALAATAKAVFELGKVTVAAAKRFETYNNQLRLITSGQADLDRTMNKLTQTAIANRTSFADTVDLFTKLTLATAELGKSEEEVLKVTTALSQALAVAGADASTTSSVIRQFGQAMASGTVRGDEFNSLVEGLGPALALMAKETGINVGTLRKMSREGELSAEVMFDMLTQSKALSQAFNTQAITTEALEIATKDAFDRALVRLDKQLGVSEKYKEVLVDITRILERFAGTETALVNMTPEQIFQGITDGTISAAAGITELEEKAQELIGTFGILVNLNNGVPGQLGFGTMPLDEFRALVEANREIIETGQPVLNWFENFIRLRKNMQDGGAPKKVSELTKEELALFDVFVKQLDAIEALAIVEKEKGDATKAELKRIEEANKAYEAWKATIIGFTGAVEDSTEALDDEAKGKFLTDIEKAQKDFDDAAETVRILEEAIASLANSGLVDASDRIDDLQNNLEAATKEMNHAEAALGELNDELAETTKPEYLKWFEDLVESAKETVQEQEFVKKAFADLEAQLKSGALTAEEYAEAVDSITEATDAFQDLLDVVDNIATMEEYEAAQARINELFNKGKIDIDEYRDALEQLKEKYEDLDPVAAAFKDALNDAGDTLADDLVEGKDALDSFKDFFKNIVKDMIKEAIKLFFIKQILGGIAGAFGYDLDFTGSNITGITKRASGGTVNNKQPYMVGEQGPELFVPNQSGNIVPNSQLGSGGGPVTNNYITNNISALDSKSVQQVFAENRQAMLGTVEYARKETSYGV